MHILELFIFPLQWPWLLKAPGSLVGRELNWLNLAKREERAKLSLSLSLSPSLFALLLFFCHPLSSTSTKTVAIAMKHARNVLNLTFTLSAILAYDPYHFYLCFDPACLLTLLIKQKEIFLSGCIYVNCLRVCEHQEKIECTVGLL